jgi:hypothetical protein
MKTELRAVLYGLSFMVIVLGLLHLAGYRITGPGIGNGPGMMMTQGGPGSGMGGGQGRPGSRRGQGGGGGGGGQQARGTQPGFGPTGGILLPIRIGTDPIPVLVDGKQTASFVGRDLIDHVQDVTVATSEGPRKGWSVPEMFKYLKIKNAKEAIVIDASGKKQAVTAQQLNDPQTIALFTYNEKGQLMLVSGPKVRGVNKGMTSLDQVKQMIAGRNDLLSISNVVKLEVKS